MSHPLYWIALQLALGIPSRKLKALLDFFGTAEAVFNAPDAKLRLCPVLTERERRRILEKPYQAARKIWDACVACGIFVLTPEHPGYPESLWNIPDMPCVLYGKGCLPPLNRIPAISIVGTRKPTVYGEIVCRRMASVLAAAGMTVISGGALGLDAVAHKAAMETGGQTVAVLGSGIESSYLRAHRPLREEIARHGALLSEYPPHAPATRYTFPARNRLIAALSLGTVVVEAGEKSGSLITADYALEQGKDVFALPGSIMSPNYKGSNRLISDGAIPVFSGLDVLDYYKNEYCGVLQMNRAEQLHRSHLEEMVVIQEPCDPRTQEKPPCQPKKTPVAVKKQPPRDTKDLPEGVRLVYNTILDTEGVALEDLVERMGKTPAEILRALTKLEMRGWIEKDPTGCYKIVNSMEE